MRIGCLQFAPQVGDLENNLNRADAVLNRANPENLDLLVLPELAFTGYNFKSLQHITPFLELCGSGISALWARTTALKYNCVVCVGYPEKVDPTLNWPTSPEYYNSVIIINEDGETVANYRKSFLYYTDETWALEGQGFFAGYIPGIGNTALGICMDINPYKFEAPWDAFEFAWHVVDSEANVVILSMAWLTREDARSYSRLPNEPDMETLTYWIQRLEPLVRSENYHEEIIVIFCNRTGTEDEAVYAGTSAVLGIKDGEVNVYGLLGRGEKELLVVDTNNPIYAKLVYRPEEDKEEDAAAASEDSDLPHHTGPRSTTLSASSVRGGLSSRGSPRRSWRPAGSSSRDMEEQAGYVTHQTTDEPSKRSKRGKPTIDIPERQGRENGAGPIVQTPTAPSPTPSDLRPKIDSEAPSGSSLRAAIRGATQYSTQSPRGSWGSANGYAFGNLPSTTSFEGSSPPSPQKYFWIPADSLLKTQFDEEAGSSTTGRDHPRHVAEETVSRAPGVQGKQLPDRLSSPQSRNVSSSRFGERSDSPLPERPDHSLISARLEELNRPGSALSRPPASAETPQPHSDVVARPSSPKSRNASRSRPDFDGRESVLSGASIYIGAAPSLLLGEIGTGSPAPARPGSRLAHRSQSPEAFYRSALHADSPFRKPLSPPPPTPGDPEATFADNAMTGSPFAADSQPQRGRPLTRAHSGFGERSEPNGLDPAAPHRSPTDLPGLPAQHLQLSEEFERIEGVISPHCPVHGRHGSVPAESGGGDSGNSDAANGSGGGSSTERDGRAEPDGGDGGGAPGAPVATGASGATEPSGTAGGLSQPEADAGTSSQSGPSSETSSIAYGLSTWNSAVASSVANLSRWTSPDTNLVPRLSPSSMGTPVSTGRVPATPLVGSTTPKAMTIIRDDDKLIIGDQASTPDTEAVKALRSVALELTPLASGREGAE